VLIHVAALNLGLLMRVLFGAGTPRSLQGRLSAFVLRLFILWHPLARDILAAMLGVHDCSARNSAHSLSFVLNSSIWQTIFTTGC
jgi:hypothetical protein